MLEQLHESGLDVDFDEARLDAVGEGESVLARRVVPRDREFGLELQRQRVGAEIGDAAEFDERQPRLEREPVHHLAADDVEFGAVGVQDVCCHLEDVRAKRAAGLQHRLAADARAARGPGPAAVGGHAGIPGDDAHFVQRDADGARRDLRHRPLGALPLLGNTRNAGHHPGRLQAQRGAVLRRDPRAADAVEGRRRIGDLDHRREPDAAINALIAQRPLFFAQLLVRHQLQEPVERLVVRQLLELDAGGEGVRIGAVGDQVFPAELRRIDAELLGREIDDALGEGDGDRMAHRAVLAGDVLVGEHHVHLRPVLLVLVRAAREIDHLVALDPAGAGIDRVRTDGGEIPEIEGENFTFPGARDPDPRLVLAGVDVGEEGLEPVGDELDRAAQHHRNRRGRHFVGVHVHLDAEGPADVLADHPHVCLGDAEVAREDVLHHVGCLGGMVDRQRVLRRVVIGEDRASLERHAGVAAELVGLLDDDVRFCERLVDAPRVEPAREADVVAEIGVNDDLAGERFLHVGDHRQLLPIGLDVLQGVLALRAGFGHHRRHRLALAARALDRDGELRRRFDALEMAEHTDPRLAVLGDRAAVECRDHARLARGLRQIEALEPRVRVGAAEEHDVRQPRKAQVVDVSAAALQEAPGVRARDALADVALVGGGARGVQRQFGAGVHFLPLRRDPSTSSTASTIAW